MMLTLSLPKELEERLVQEAERHGLTAAEYTVQILEAQLPPVARRAELVALLQTWIEEGDSEEQRETGDQLIRALDEDRLSDRKLFPPELQGVTW
jgi:hypothetical protein